MLYATLFTTFGVGPADKTTLGAFYTFHFFDSTSEDTAD